MEIRRTSMAVTVFLATGAMFSSTPVMQAQTRPNVIRDAKHDVSPPLRSLTATPVQTAGAQQQAPVPRPTRPPIASSQPDPFAQQPIAPLSGVSTVLNFDGQSANDNRNVLGFAFVPPDTNGAVGTTQFVQIVNVTFAVYDKRNGALTLGPAAINTVWQGFGGPCEAGNGGDPIVLHDQLAGRWLISQLQFNSTFSSNQQCIAISTTSDATGSYNRYEFDFGANLPDYPKFGVWPDAYYYSANIFPSGHTFAGAQACAFDRAAMLAGSSATKICFQNPPSVASLLPSELDGSTLPP